MRGILNNFVQEPFVKIVDNWHSRSCLASAGLPMMPWRNRGFDQLRIRDIGRQYMINFVVSVVSHSRRRPRPICDVLTLRPPVFAQNQGVLGGSRVLTDERNQSFGGTLTTRDF